MTEPRQLPPRYVFVCGLHRSGTSLLARLVAAHPDVAALHAPDVPEGEGVYLQGAIPHTAQHGVPGSFAFDPEQHLTEAHPLNRLETRLRIEADWSPRFAPDRPWRLEKSPVNLLRTRLYQQLFPMAHFIVVTRHPVAVAQATAKWSDTSLPRLVDHWAAAHRIALEDLARLHAALVIRYEDLCGAPGVTLAQIARFLSLDTPLACAEPVGDGNARYREMPGEPPPEATVLGYGRKLRPERAMPDALICRHPLRAIRESVLDAARCRGHRAA